MSTLKVNRIEPRTGDTVEIVGFGGESKNLIINGAMQVAQRGTRTGQGGTNSYSAVDRWEFVSSSAARVTTSHDTSGLGNFSNTLKIDCTTADTSISASDQAGVRTKLESQDLQHLLWGTAFAKPLTLQFTVSSPKAGIHCVQAHNRDAAYSYVQEFTVTSANTAEEFTLTIPGDTSNGFAKDSGAGLEICFPLHNGTNWQTTSGSWQSGNFFSTSNQQNLLDNVANNFYLTGIQLQVGSVATPFEHESYGQTVAKCQRYYQKSYIDSVVAGSVSLLGAQMVYISGTGNTFRSTLVFKGQMRANPTATFYVPETGTSGFGGYEGSGDTDKQSINATFLTNKSYLLYNTSIGRIGTFYWQYQLDAEL
jgi:hypothetical protein